MLPIPPAFLALLATPTSHSILLPAKVSEVTIEDLVRYSDAVVVGKVERIEIVHRPLEEISPPPEFVGDLGADVPFAEVVISRVLKGPEELKRVIYLATSTWTCDTTTAEVGETVLLFLGNDAHSELFDRNLRRRVRASLPKGEWMHVMWSGRGRMPIRTFAGVEHVTYSTDVEFPESAPVADDPEAGYSDFTGHRAVPLAWIEDKVKACLKEQKELWFRASVSEVRDGTFPWELEVALDGHARLVIHDPSADREERFLVPTSRLPGITMDLRHAHRRPPPERVGSGSPIAGVRRLQVVPPEPEIDLRIFSIDEHWIGVADRKRATRTVLDAWEQIRGSFDEPRCADHRATDAPWRN